jgi:hypothetical protein
MLIQVVDKTTDTVAKAQMHSGGDRIADLDPHTLSLLAVGAAIIMLYFIVFRFMKMIEGRLSALTIPPATKKSAAPRNIAEPINSADAPDTETFAAIAMALHLYKNDLHDREQAVLTINRVGKMYTPWSSKIYGLRNNPR